MDELWTRGILGLQGIPEAPPRNAFLGLLAPATANQNMLAQATRARELQPRNQLTGYQAGQLAGMIPGAGLLGVLGDLQQYAEQPETRGLLNYGLTALGALPFLGAMAKMAGARPAGLMMREAGIIAPDVAKSLNTTTNLPSSPEFSAAVKNTPGASVTQDGLSMRVTRNQLPEQGLEPSVRGGVFYLPEGAAQQKHYSTGKMGYGGPERISGETLFQNPIFAKGGTGGRAPASAYDHLIGKGAYDAMRDDALKTVRGWNMTMGQKVDAAREFLQKHAPEMVDQADYIVQNSGKGNQLPYALQEAAVASAVRKAGHDSVIGHSKGKSGPFISEVFDVREMNYPDKFGTPTDIWDSFLKKLP